MFGYSDRRFPPDPLGDWERDAQSEPKPEKQEEICRQPGCTRPAVEEIMPGWLVCRDCAKQMAR